MSTSYRHVLGNPIMGLGDYARLRVPRPTIQGGENNSATEQDVGTTGGLTGTLTNFTDLFGARVNDVPTGLAGRSLLLAAASSQHVVLASTFAAAPSTATIGGWFKRTSAVDAAIFGVPGSATGYAPLFYNTDGLTYVGASAATEQVSWTYAPNTSWHHVAVTVTTTTSILIYIDGVVVAGGAKILTNGLTAISAIAKSGVGNYWTGNLHDLRIYSQTLSAAEVDEWFDTNAVTGKSPIHRWTFN